MSALMKMQHRLVHTLSKWHAIMQDEFGNPTMHGVQQDQPAVVEAFRKGSDEEEGAKVTDLDVYFQQVGRSTIATSPLLLSLLAS